MDTTGICLTEGCGKPLAVRQAKYCPDCAKARNRAWKAAYARRRAAEAREGRVVRRRAPACPEFYAPLQEILAAGACASAVEVHAALAARMPAGAAVPDVSALRFHCRHRGIALPHRSPADHARHMLAGRLAGKLIHAPDTPNETAAKRRRITPRGGSAPAAPPEPPPPTEATPNVASATSNVAPEMADAFDQVAVKLLDAMTELRDLVGRASPELRRLARIEEALTALGFTVAAHKED